MCKALKVLLILLVIIGFSAVESSSASTNINAPSMSPSQIISMINDYRQENGVHALSVNSTLMSLAQGQSDYQASTGNITHTGPGGTTPKDRAYGADYGDGNKIFLSEIIYGGSNATPDDALTWWKGSSLHNRVMLDSQYVEIGAGVSTAGNWTYFTAEIGWVTVYPAPAEAGAISSSSNGEDSQDGSVPAPIAIVKATPREDGSIIHIVQSGQTLWAIAAVYEIDLDTLLSQNQMTRTSFVFPGDKIIVRPSGSTTSTPDPSAQNSSGEKTPEDIKPQVIGTAVSFSTTGTPTTKVTTTSTPIITSDLEEELENPSVRWVTILAFVVIFLVVVGSLFFQKQPERPPDDDVVR
jgi:LysM repeat protein